MFWLTCMRRQATAAAWRWAIDGDNDPTRIWWKLIVRTRRKELYRWKKNEGQFAQER